MSRVRGGKSNDSNSSSDITTDISKDGKKRDFTRIDEIRNRKDPVVRLVDTIREKVSEVKSRPKPVVVPGPLPKEVLPDKNAPKPNPLVKNNPEKFEDVIQPIEIQENPFHWRNLYKFTQVHKQQRTRVSIEHIPSSFYGISFDELSVVAQMQVTDLIHTLIVEGFSDPQIMEELDMAPETLLYIKKRLYADAETAELDKTNLDRYVDYAQFVKCRTKDLMKMVQIAPNDSDKYMKAKIDAISKTVEMRRDLLKVGVELHIIDKEEEAGSYGRVATTKMTDEELKEYITKEKRNMASLYRELQGLGVNLIEEDDEESTPDEVISSFNIEEDLP